MASKTDFTAEEWQVLQWAIVDTMAYLSMADRGFWDSFKEATGAAKYIAAARSESTSILVRDLAGDVKAKRDKEVASNPTNMAGEVAERLAEAVAIVTRVAPDELEAFKAFVLGVGQATAEAADNVAGSEAEALENVKAALG